MNSFALHNAIYFARNMDLEFRLVAFISDLVGLDISMLAINLGVLASCSLCTAVQHMLILIVTVFDAQRFQDEF